MFRGGGRPGRSLLFLRELPDRERLRIGIRVSLVRGGVPETAEEETPSRLPELLAVHPLRRPGGPLHRVPEGEGGLPRGSRPVWGRFPEGGGGEMRPRRVLVVGAAGMLGHVLFSGLSGRSDLEVHATARTAEGLDRWFPRDLLGKIRGGVDAERFDTVLRALPGGRPGG